MRALFLVLLLWPLTASAEVRLATHAGGGIEGLMVDDASPGGVVEVGATAVALKPGKRWGFAVGVARVGRSEGDVANEWKLDGGFCIANKSGKFHAIIGVGVRSMTIPGGDNRPESTIRGFDVIRTDERFQLVRRGPIALDFYFGWTFGLYHGTKFETRIGDMAQPTRGVTQLTTTYVLGLSTSVVLD